MSKRIAILVEGDSDKRFLECFLEFKNFNLDEVVVNVISIGGKDKEISSEKKKIMVPENESGINLLIEDLDADDVDTRRAALETRLAGFSYDSFFIGESQDEKQLEDLLLASTGKDLSVYDKCFNSFNDCLASVEFSNFIPSIKEKVYWYTMILLSDEESTQRKVISPAQIDYSDGRFYDLSASCYDKLEEFLTKYIKKK